MATSDAATILDTCKDAGMQADQDHQAAHAVKVIGKYMKTNMGLDLDQLPEIGQGTGLGGLKNAAQVYAQHL